ncbi:Las1-domain-containing protein [Rhizoclosmatium globosum]|uniref:Las1-domain-containing protein n=1 Tax=Rhizoclosmatium globosum TaxID=329046 RepID=A0A1Y2CMK6_9FUNG|nr:Las1-domain-containing protein [Rhizoclosmatium globosum]|eukprot:ORY48242.1 Las1-domain-containing protein [Rhizoclosmatium globosum]
MAVNNSKRIGRVVPWASHSEWEQTYHWLYAHQIEGVRRVRGWASRGKVPHAVDATAMFVEIWLRDRSGLVSEHELRLMYSIAFVRFVNGVVDAQQKGVYAGSVAGIAESLGLPAWFVDLRHSGTHDRLPSISLLRSGCHQALDWLNTNYWIVQTTYLSNTASDVQELLGRYLESVHSGDTGAGTAAIKDITTIILADNYRDFLIPILVGPGYLVPDSKKMRSKYTDLTLNPEVQHVWMGPIDSFQAAWPGFLEDLIMAIISGFVDPSKTSESLTEDGGKNPQYSMSYQSTLASWAKHILKTKVLSNPANSVASGEDGASLIDNIMQACLGNPNIFSRHLLTDIASNNKEVASHLKPFISFVDDSFKSAVIAEVSNDASALEKELVFLQSRLKEIQELGNVPSLPVVLPEIASKKTGETMWKLATELTWHRVPIGHVPGIGLPNLDLSPEVDEPGFRYGVFEYPILENMAGNGAFEISETIGDEDGENAVAEEEASTHEYSHSLLSTTNVLSPDKARQVAKKIRIL